MPEQDDIKQFLQEQVNEMQRKNRKQWNWVFSILTVVGIGLLTIGVFQLRVSTRNSTIINDLLQDERYAVDFKTWFAHVQLTNIRFDAIENQNDNEKLNKLMDRTDKLENFILSQYQERTRETYRGMLKDDKVQEK